MTKARWNAGRTRPTPRSRPRAGCSPSPAARAASARVPSPSTSPPRSPLAVTPSVCSTPTSGDSPCPACSASPSGWRRVASRGRPSRLIIPNERIVGDGLLKVVSTGFLVEEDTALMWRGLMLTKAVEQFLRDVRWGDARLPADRHAARHRRRADGTGPHAAAHRSDRGHHAGPGRTEGRPARRRHGQAQLPARRRRHREHEHVHLRARRLVRAVR